MSSNSSVRQRAHPPGEDVAEMIAESFEMIRREVPAAYTQMCEPLAGQSIVIEVDGRVFHTRFEADGASVAETGQKPLAEVRTDARAILGVIEGRHSLARAVTLDEVAVKGPLDALIRMREVLHRYIHGVVRCPSAPSLLVRFERLVEGQEARRAIENDLRGEVHV